MLILSVALLASGDPAKVMIVEKLSCQELRKPDYWLMSVSNLARKQPFDCLACWCMYARLVGWFVRSFA